MCRLAWGRGQGQGRGQGSSVGSSSGGNGWWGWVLSGCQVGCAGSYFHARLKINLLVSFLLDAQFNFNVFSRPPPTNASISNAVHAKVLVI